LDAHLQLAKSQQHIIQRLKSRGPQSVKILANQLGMTTMGVRQHLAELDQAGLIQQTEEEKQTRGRPVHLWRLTSLGHQQFPDAHAQVTVELIAVMRETLGEDGLKSIINKRNEQVLQQYRKQLDQYAGDLPRQIQCLADLRSAEGYLSEVRLLPNGGWLLIENHCPICAAAEACQQFCHAELALFQQLLGEKTVVERSDHLLAGARRCAYRIDKVIEG